MMERCPNCGTPARPGAKFCTTCGFRFLGDASDNESAHDHAEAAAPDTDEEPGLFPGAMTDGWPTPPPPAETVGGGWDAPAPAPAAAPSEPGDTIEADATSDSSAAIAVDSWPARPVVAVADTASAEPEPQPDEQSERESVANLEADVDNQAETAEATARAMRLLDELRQTISEIGPGSDVDLGGVISDLEVAVHPPGAMAAEDVAELRDALLAARERPRDVDTILDLTKRIDAMLALVIAYDRTIAAIERSLEALRGDR
jgi:hypothetical protein